MAIKAGKWCGEWEMTLGQFERANTAAGKKHKIAGSTKWWESNKKDAVKKAFKTADEVYNKASAKLGSNPWPDPVLAGLEKTFQAAVKSGDEYLAVLKKLLDKEAKAQKSNKGLGDDYTSAIKILTKDLKACQASVKATYLELKLAAEKSKGSAGDAGDKKQLKVVRARLAASCKELSTVYAKAAKEPSEFYALRDDALKDMLKAINDLSGQRYGEDLKEILDNTKGLVKHLLQVRPAVKLSDKERVLYQKYKDLGKEGLVAALGGGDQGAREFVAIQGRIDRDRKETTQKALAELRRLIDTVAKGIVKGVLDKIPA